MSREKTRSHFKNTQTIARSTFSKYSMSNFRLNFILNLSFDCNTNRKIPFSSSPQKMYTTHKCSLQTDNLNHMLSSSLLSLSLTLVLSQLFLRSETPIFHGLSMRLNIPWTVRPYFVQWNWNLRLEKWNKRFLEYLLHG